MATRPLGAQISHMLKSRGVDVIFGIPGVHNQEMYRGIEEAGIMHVLARHEQGAGFMADGYARATGLPGVAYVITGPGLCNIMTPMGQAYSDSVPLLVISSCLDETASRRGQLHQMRDQAAAARTVCDWSDTARTPEAAFALIDRALLEFETQRPRPKHIQVPIHLLEADAQPCTRLRPRRSDHARPLLKQVQQIHAHLIRARRPVIIFGGGVACAKLPLDSGWLDRVREIPRLSKAVSLTTYAGRGTVALDDPLYLGSGLARPQSADVLAQADLVLAVGTELAEVDLWRHDLGHDCPLYRVDIDPKVLADPQQAETVCRCDSVAFLEPLADLLFDCSAYDSDWLPEDIARLRAQWRRETDAERPGVLPICDALQAALPEDTMVFSDMTQFAYVANEVWPMARPGHWHHPYGFGTLGYALPAAIGGAMARSGKPTLAIAGDYGFQYTLQELGTAVELGLSLPILIWDNGKLKEIEDSMVRAQIAPHAVKARNPDFCALAAAYGAHTSAPKSIAAIVDAVQAAFNADAPTLIYMTPGIS